MSSTGTVRTEAQRQRERLAKEAREAKAGAKRQAEAARAEARRQAEAERVRTTREAKARQAEITRQAKARQAEVRRSQSETEREAEAVKAQVREAQRLEQRKRDLPFTRPRDIGAKAFISEVEATRQLAHKKGRSARADIGKQKVAFLADVDTAKAEIFADIDKQVSGIEADIAKKLAQAQLDIAAQQSILATEIDDWESQSLKALEKATKDYENALTEFASQAGGVELTGQQVFDGMVKAGDIPNNAVYESYTPSAGMMGKISYITPDNRTGKQIFGDMVAAGDIPKNAVYESYTPTTATTGQITYTLPDTMTPRQQFDNWKASDPTAPTDAVYEGKSLDGGFMYSSPSTMRVEVETASGKATMLMSEWEAMSNIKQYELVLGRPPTLTEWQGYRLMEAGIDLAWWKELIPGIADFVGLAASLIPGEIEEESMVKVNRKAHHEWQSAYPELKWTGTGVAILENLGFSAAKAFYPQVTVKDVTGKEWAMTGLNVALWTLPLWLPKVIRGVKVLMPNRQTARLRTVPFSETAGLKKAPTVTTKTIGPREVGMSESQYGRFLRARVTNPRLTPDTFKVLESMGSKIKTVTAPVIRRLTPKKLTGLPKYTYPSRVGVKELTRAEWLSKWKPSQVQPTFGAAELVPPGWVRTASGKFMPAGVQPISLPDVPIGLVIRSPIITGTGKIITPIGVNQIVKSLNLTPQQIAGTQSLSRSQSAAVSRYLGISQSKVDAIAKQGKLSQTIQQNLTTLQSKLAGLTTPQAVTFIKSLTKLQAKELTQTELQSLAKTLNLNMTELQSVLKTMTELQPVAKEGLRTFKDVVLKGKATTRTPAKGKPPKKGIFPKPGPGEKAVTAGKRRVYPPGTAVFLMGIWWKIIPPPYTLLKPISSKLPPKGVRATKGTPQQTLTFIGGKIPYKNVAFDLGVVDGYIDVRKREIIFSGGGMKTNIGKRIESPTKGLSLSNVRLLRVPKRRRHVLKARKPEPTITVGWR